MMSLFHLASTFMTLLTCAVMAGCPADARLEKYSCRPLSDAALDHRAPHLAGLAPFTELVSQPMQLTLQLPLVGRDDLRQHIKEQHDPSSRRFGRYMTPSDFHLAHLPSAAQGTAVVRHMQDHGVKAALTSPAFVTAEGQADSVARSFGAKLGTFRDAKGDTYVAPYGNRPSLPMPIVAAHGLSTPAARESYAVAHQGASLPLTPQRFRTAYNLPPERTAEGQTVGLFALDGYKRSDLEAFAHSHNLPMPNIRHVFVNGYDGSIETRSGQIETTMDLQILMAAQPKEIVVFAAKNTHTGFIDVLRRIAQPLPGEAVVPLISCSWGTPEVTMPPAEMMAQEDLLMQLAVQGQTLVAAAGDSGAKDDGRHVGVDSPASSPHVLACGGTTLTLTPEGAWAKETVWWKSGLAGVPDSGTGGGLSCVFGVPAWQLPTLSVSRGARSKLKRNLPDVSLCADPAGPGYEVIVDGQTLVVGGTSCSAPAMTGILAMVEADRAKRGRAALGFYTPHIYAIGTSQPQVFHDIADGNTNGLYDALPGYDDATGFGSVDGEAFIRALSAR